MIQPLPLETAMTQDTIGRRMKVGVFSRLGERTLDGQRVRFRDIKALAVAAEIAG